MRKSPLQTIYENEEISIWNQMNQPLVGNGNGVCVAVWKTWLNCVEWCWACLDIDCFSESSSSI
jgi:hypothetical protein